MGKEREGNGKEWKGGEPLRCLPPILNVMDYSIHVIYYSTNHYDEVRVRSILKSQLQNTSDSRPLYRYPLPPQNTANPMLLLGRILHSVIFVTKY